MEKNPAHKDKKPLQFKKSAVARLTMSDRQQQFILGVPILGISRCGFDEPAPCTTIPTIPTL